MAKKDRKRAIIKAVAKTHFKYNSTLTTTELTELVKELKVLQKHEHINNRVVAHVLARSYGPMGKYKLFRIVRTTEDGNTTWELNNKELAGLV